MKHLFHAYSMMLIALLLSSCQFSTSEKAVPLTPTMADNSMINDQYLYDSACSSPCWQGLIPGKSTAKDVQEVFDSFGPIEWPGRHIENYASGCKWIRASSTRPDRVVDLHLENDMLTFVKVVDVTKHFDLQRTVGLLGQPEYFQAILALGPEDHIYSVEVYYPQKGIAFELYPSNDPGIFGKILPEMKIEEIHYFAPGDIYSYFTSRYSCDFGYSSAMKRAQQEVSGYVQPWSGFGDVKMITTQ